MTSYNVNYLLKAPLQMLSDLRLRLQNKNLGGTDIQSSTDMGSASPRCSPVPLSPLLPCPSVALSVSQIAGGGLSGCDNNGRTYLLLLQELPG